ncbi:MAG TPA: hypothetical protein DEP45_00120 [Armatimonadetes bacterium]|nr:hypothetical protein [Armatimonadota bacterium]
MKLPSAINSALERTGLKQKSQLPLTREQAFEARPVRNPALKWRVNDEDFVEVIVPRRKDLFGRAMGFLFFVPESRPIILDEVGTRVWHLCDGEHTVQDIVRALSADYKLQRREVEASLTEYLRTLGKKGMIGFLVPKEALEDEDAGELVGLEEIGTTREDLERAQRQAEEEASAAEASEAEAAEPESSDDAAPDEDDPKQVG